MKFVFNVADLLTILTLALAEENISDSEELHKSQAQETLELLVNRLTQSQAAEGLYYLIKEPDSKGAKTLLRIQLKELIKTDATVRKLSLSIVENSHLLKTIKSIEITNLNFSDNDNTIQIGNSNISIGNASQRNIQIGNGKIRINKIE